MILEEKGAKYQVALGHIESIKSSPNAIKESQVCKKVTFASDLLALTPPVSPRLSLIEDKKVETSIPPAEQNESWGSRTYWPKSVIPREFYLPPLYSLMEPWRALAALNKLAAYGYPDLFDFGFGELRISCTIWIPIHRPIVEVEYQFGYPVDAMLSFELSTAS